MSRTAPPRSVEPYLVDAGVLYLINVLREPGRCVVLFVRSVLQYGFVFI
jgi:hypothetical protein